MCLRKPTRNYIPIVVFSVGGSIQEKKKISTLGRGLIYNQHVQDKAGKSVFPHVQGKKNVTVVYTSIEFSILLRSLFRNIAERIFLTKLVE